MLRKLAAGLALALAASVGSAAMPPVSASPHFERQVRVVTVTPSDCSIRFDLTVASNFCLLGSGRHRIEALCSTGARKNGPYVRARHSSIVVCFKGFRNLRTGKVSKWIVD